MATLEREVAEYSNTKFAIGCASGSDALLLALMALDLQPRDEVITTPFSFFATASAITRLGAAPQFVDIDPQTYNLDSPQSEAAITSRTRAIMPVHMYGQCAEMDAILGIAARHGLPVVEDAAQAIGAEDRGRRAGSMGQVGCISFYPTKNLGGAGDGGMLVANDEALAERLRRLRVHGGATEYHHDEVGINSRLDAIQAAILRVKLQHLDNWSEARREKAAVYTGLLHQADLAIEIVPPFISAEARHIFHQYVVRIPEHRDAIMKYLAEHAIGTKVYYPVPLHLQPAYADLGYSAGAFPASEQIASTCFSLPMFPELTEAQVERVCKVVTDHVSAGS